MCIYICRLAEEGANEILVANSMRLALSSISDAVRLGDFLPRSTSEALRMDLDWSGLSLVDLASSICACTSYVVAPTSGTSRYRAVALCPSGLQR